MTNEHFKHIAELYAKSKGWQLSQYADKIINRCLNVCEGKCPCDMNRGLCPCGLHEEEVNTQGHCHCNLFIK